MWKRVAAIFFILILAGQVWASVCGCLENQSSSKTSCCKSKKANKVKKAKQCCDSFCRLPANDHSPRSQSESTIKIPAPVMAAVEKLIISLDWQSKPVNTLSIPKRAGETPLRLLHPPGLYLQNHAFLI